MRHTIAHRKFGRTTNQRKALFCNLANALIEKEKIITTLPKAKDLRPIVEKLVTVGKRSEPLSAHRLTYKFLRNNNSCRKIVQDLAKRYAQRPGGYLRILKYGYRYGDNAPMAIIEFVGRKTSGEPLAS